MNNIDPSNIFSDRMLEGKTAFIAGGTRGMNLAIAKLYAHKGAAVAVMSRDEARVKSATDMLRTIHGNVLGFSADVRDYEATQNALSKSADQFGGLDIIVAGQAGNFYAAALGMSSNGFRTIIDIDLIGTFNVFRAGFEYLNRAGASLIAISAPEAVTPMHFQSHVCAAKAGVNMLCKCLALEWGPAGVRVNAISPGPIEGSWGMKNVASPSKDIVDRITRRIPLRRWGTEADIARAALFLASPASSYMTGTILDMDGGVGVAMTGETPDAVFDFTSDSRIRKKSKT